jgi:hypothetical protein
MMRPEDLHILVGMRAAVQNFRCEQNDVGVLADRLLELRDQLQFSDPAWFDELTQHIATLDSASTFQPKDDKEAEQLAQAIAHANAQVLDLVTRKTEQLQKM